MSIHDDARLFDPEMRALGLTTASRSVASFSGGSRDLGAWGLVDGVPVGVRRRLTLEGTTDEVHAALWPPLDLGLHVRPQGLLARLFLDLVQIDDHETGDAVFDRGFRVGGEEAARASALLDGDVREAITELTGLDLGDLGAEAASVAVRDEIVASRGPAAGLTRRIHAATCVAAALRRAAREVPHAAAVEPYLGPMQRLTASYGFTRTATPLAAEGAIDDLSMGVLVRRLADGTRVLEVGCVVDPGMRYELEVVPRQPRVEAGPPDLFEPAFHLEPAPVPFELASTFVVRASPEVKDRLGGILTPPAMTAIVALMDEIDVVLQFGVLTLRRRLDSLAPSELEQVFDRAVAGARTIVPAVAGGYRGGRR